MIAHVNLLIALTTPPMGIGLYIMTGVAKIKFEDVLRAFWPFFIPLMITLLLVTYIPWLTLFLPNLFMGR
jgi:TRAP-type C4-dicarboxylate transport system permease large subunit